MCEIVEQAHRDRRCTAGAMRIRNVEGIIAEHAHQHVGQPAGRDRIGMPCDRHRDRIGRLDIQRDELDLRIHAVGAEVTPGQGIVEGLVQLWSISPLSSAA